MTRITNRKYSIIRDPLNGNRWQVRVKTFYSDGTHVEGDAGDPCASFMEAVRKESTFMFMERL